MTTPCGLLLLQVVGGDVVLDEITTVCSGVAAATGHCPFLVFVGVIEESGWSLIPTCFGGFLPLRVVPSSGEPGLLLVFEALDPLSPGDAMVGGLLQLEHSTISVHVDVFEVLLMEAIKNCEVSSSERRSTSSVWLLRPPVTETTGSLRRLECIFFLFQGCLCKFWDVITKKL
ncbi:hypothetical protein BS78_03G391700 [Paspalum vaginatum]|nr:hypothetical protein BS78_03G391700 [Paspalum vaginatum]